MKNANAKVVIPENPYLLLTPGPLSTSAGVRAAMLRDWCTWDDDYKQIVQQIRHRLVALATPAPGYTAVLMQGSGTFAVEATLTSVIPEDGRLLVLDNGAYGRRLAEIARRQRIALEVLEFSETEAVAVDRVAACLSRDPRITHVALVHCETTTGMLNPAAAIGALVKAAGRRFILDAMSSFGGLSFDPAALGVDFLVSSANKCIQGVPGFAFVIAAEAELRPCRGRARSLSLDLYDQWRVMEEDQGKWRFTSPTHTVRAFRQALQELEEEGGIVARARRYQENQRLLVKGMSELGFRPLLPESLQSPIITAFYSPEAAAYNFNDFYQGLKARGFVIYPGKVSRLETFRIGNIGEVYADDIKALLAAVAATRFWSEA